MIDIAEMIGVIIASCAGTGLVAVVGVVIFLKGELIRLTALHEHQTQTINQNVIDIGQLKEQVANIDKRTSVLELTHV